MPTRALAWVDEDVIVLEAGLVHRYPAVIEALADVILVRAGAAHVDKVRRGILPEEKLRGKLTVLMSKLIWACELCILVVQVEQTISSVLFVVSATYELIP